MPPSDRTKGPLGGRTTSTAGGLRRTTVLVEPEDLRRLRRIAADRETSISDLVRQAVRDFLEKLDKQPK